MYTFSPERSSGGVISSSEHESTLALSKEQLPQSDAAASIKPAPLNSPGLVISTFTGYFHSMNLPHPGDCQLLVLNYGRSSCLPQYAAFLPKYFPK